MGVRKLRLRQEALADLTTDELGAVAGASGLPCGTVRCGTVLTYSYLVTGCMCTGAWPSLRLPCTGDIAISGVLCP